MDVDEVEVVLEKIWDLHDKLSDAIHSVSRTHFLDSVGAGRGGAAAKHSPDDDRKGSAAAGFVFVKDFRGGFGDDALREAKSLNAIRTALENLEDQLEFFHTVHIQQRVERDAAIARLEQSRIILAMRLSEHHGKKYKVIEEALAFVGDVGEASRFVSRDARFSTATGLSGQENSLLKPGNKCKILIKLLVSSLSFARKSLGLDHVGGLLGNAALVGITMFAMIHFNNSSRKELLLKHEGDSYSITNRDRIRKEVQSPRGSSSRRLDVLLARG